MIDDAAVPKHSWITQALHVLIRKVHSQFFQQLCPVFGAVFAVLLKLDDVGSDEPIADDQRLIHRRCCTALELSSGGGDGFEEAGVVHFLAL